MKNESAAKLGLTHQPGDRLTTQGIMFTFLGVREEEGKPVPLIVSDKGQEWDGKSKLYKVGRLELMRAERADVSLQAISLEPTFRVKMRQSGVGASERWFADSSL